MRRIKTLLIICNLVIGCLAQTQQGMAYRYNGKSPRTPLSNVTIVYDENKRSTISAENGSFALTLVGRKMGDRIGQVTVKKREMMVFNQSAVDEWSVRKDPLMLILCNTDEFERQKENLIAIGKREAKKKYDKQKADLESQLSASKIKAAEYEAALDKAYEDLERLQKNIGEYADLFARIDESEIDTLAQRAVDLFNHGEVDEAIMLFEQGHYMEKLKKAKELKQQASIAKAQIDQAEAKANEDSLIAVQSIRAQIEAYKLKNDWNNVGELLKGLADELGTIRENWDYAAFSGDQNDYKEAEIYFERTLNLVEEKEVGEEYLIDKGKLLNSLGTIYTNTQRLKEAEVKYKDALEIFRSLSKTNPNEHNENLCNVLNNLAILYYITQQMENSEAFFVEGLDVSREMAEYDAKKYQPDYARALNNMAIFYTIRAYSRKTNGSIKRVTLV